MSKLNHHEFENQGYYSLRTMTIDIEVSKNPEKTSTKLSHTGTALLQKFTPINSICVHLNGLHYYVDDPSRQVEANHYCSQLSEDVSQCLIYDGHDRDHAKLIGVEYIISKNIFDSLDPEEQKYWHSHAYEILSGILMMPSIPQMMEDSEMQKLVNTFGKTWHFWQIDRGDPLPFGPPKLMGAFTKDGQVNAQLLKLRDEKFETSSHQLREHRVHKLNVQSISYGADSWESNR